MLKSYGGKAVNIIKWGEFIRQIKVDLKKSMYIIVGKEVRIIVRKKQ